MAGRPGHGRRQPARPQAGAVARARSRSALGRADGRHGRASRHGRQRATGDVGRDPRVRRRHAAPTNFLGDVTRVAAAAGGAAAAALRALYALMAGVWPASRVKTRRDRSAYEDSSLLQVIALPEKGVSAPLLYIGALNCARGGGGRAPGLYRQGGRRWRQRRRRGERRRGERRQRGERRRGERRRGRRWRSRAAGQHEGQGAHCDLPDVERSARRPRVLMPGRGRLSRLCRLDMGRGERPRRGLVARPTPGRESRRGDGRGPGPPLGRPALFGQPRGDRRPAGR